MKQDKMTIQEQRAAMSLGLVFAIRMLGLFMILPVFSVFAPQISGSTPVLIGVALGIYGLTQALFQIPFAMLSDRIGRKPVILCGLLIFCLGSIMAAFSHSITGIIIGRAIQGAGAVGSTIIALVADLTRDEHRTKAMASVGMSIGFAFSIAIVMGPIITGWGNLNSIFWLTAILGALGIIVLYTVVPTPTRLGFQPDVEPAFNQLKNVLRQPELMRLNFGILIQHALLTATFVAIPIALHQFSGLSQDQWWQVYLPVFVLAFIVMIIAIIRAEKYGKLKSIFLISVSVLLLAELLLLRLHYSVLSLGFCLFLFFTAFTTLEALLPSLVSRTAPKHSRGTAMGVYSTSQFLGIFIGGILGGWSYSMAKLTGVFTLGIGMTLLWLIIASFMQAPAHKTSNIETTGDIHG